MAQTGPINSSHQQPNVVHSLLRGSQAVIGELSVAQLLTAPLPKSPLMFSTTWCTHVSFEKKRANGKWQPKAKESRVK